jgi:hypothetical protein
MTAAAASQIIINTAFIPYIFSTLNSECHPACASALLLGTAAQLIQPLAIAQSVTPAHM